MRKFLTHLKTDQKISWKQWPQLIGVYAILPFILMLFMGIISTSSITDNFEFDPISIAVENNDNSDLSTILVDVINSEDAADFFEVEEAETATYRIEIEEGYGENLLENRINIHAAPNSSSSDLSFLEMFIQDYQQFIYEEVELHNIMNTEVSSEEREAIAAVLLSSDQFDQEFNVDRQVFETPNALSPLQVSATSGLLYICILLASQESNMRSQEQLKGLNKRTSIAPLKPWQQITYSLTSQTITGTILSTIYMVLWKIIYPELFSGNFLVYVFIAAAMTFAFLSVFKLLNSIFPAQVVTMFYTFALVIYLMLGMMPADANTGNPFMELMSSNPLRRIFQDPINDYSLRNVLAQEHLIIQVALIAFGLVMMLIAIGVAKRKEVKG